MWKILTGIIIVITFRYCHSAEFNLCRNQRSCEIRRKFGWKCENGVCVRTAVSSVGDENDCSPEAGSLWPNRTKNNTSIRENTVSAKKVEISFNHDNSGNLDDTSKHMIKERYQHVFTNNSLCNVINPSSGLVITIPSAISNIKNRQHIRKTWQTAAVKENISVRFFIGLNSEGNVDPDIIEENKKHNDIVILRNMIDTYQNLPLKTLSIFEWSQKCTTVRFVVKCDDDVFVNIPKLLQVTKKHWNNKQCIIGDEWKNFSPYRDKSSKYYVSKEQYPNPTYPHFAHGPFYILDIVAVEALYHQSLRSSIWIPLEDVLFTGIVREQVGISITSVDHFLDYQNNNKWKCTGYVAYNLCCKIGEAMSFLFSNCKYY